MICLYIVNPLPKSRLRNVFCVYANAKVYNENRIERAIGERLLVRARRGANTIRRAFRFTSHVRGSVNAEAFKIYIDKL